ncbi:ABC transporter ATP-binding protein [Mycoplasma sp. P36-A1]|uniref:ABC transporter ATP-binding protein n=1 Tax=Mycoplasma sp. P36-A1 TaxID=3252900 RepID=UPI003C2C48A4
MSNKSIQNEKNRFNKSNTALRLLAYVTSTYKFRFFLVLVFIIISALANVIGSVFIKTLVDDYITPLIQNNGADYAPLLKAILTMGLIYLVGAFCNLIYARLMVMIGQGVQKRIRDEMFEHMQQLPISYFDTHQHGDIMSHFTNDIDALRQMISQSIPQTLQSVVTMTSIIVTMFIMSFRLTLIVLIVIAFTYLISKTIANNSKKYFQSQQKNIGSVNGYIEEMLKGQKVVKIFNHEKVAIEDFDKLNYELYQSSFKANAWGNLMMPSMLALMNLMYVLIGGIGTYYAIVHSMFSVGLIISFLSLSRSLINPVTQIGQQINFIIMALAGASRIFELMDENVETDEGEVTLVNVETIKDNLIVECSEKTANWAWKVPQANNKFEYIELKGDVRFFDVDFYYNKNKQILHDVSLYAKPGEKIAFVGATGAGKTTITNLINRFYDIQEGRITYDGINIKNIKKSSLRKSLGIVLQDTNMFTGTIKENIKFGSLQASDEDVIKAAKLANAHDFINTLPLGYDTIIDGLGGSLSQGQMQLLSIARAAINNPPVMILDEATSSIDTRTEQIVQSGMDKLMFNRTVFVIAHRLSTIKNADAIMVMDQGRIVERGDHDDLIKQHGIYNQLYTGSLELE